MPAIGIIDDRSEHLKQLATALNFELPEKWETVPLEPLAELHDYPSWIAENEVVALLIDEKLNEVQGTASGIAVNYYGHDLVDFLRSHLPTFPIFIVTAYSTESELQERFGAVEGIIQKAEFLKDVEKYAPRIIRAGQHYLYTFESELATLSDFASKAAIGQKLTDAEQKRAKAIQTKIGTAFSVDGISDRSQWLGEMEETLNELEKLKDEIESFLDGSSNDEMAKNS
jgi:DNA-binding NarL/FixJ family response regulator